MGAKISINSHSPEVGDQREPTILIDTREKLPWIFPNSRTYKLKTGDYTLEGFEDILVIERKMSVSEIAQNLLQSRFDKELQRCMDYKHAYLIMEFDMCDVIFYPQTSNLPQQVKDKVRISGQYILSKLTDLSLRYGIQLIFAGSYGKEISSKIFRKIQQLYPDRLRAP